MRTASRKLTHWLTAFLVWAGLVWGGWHLLTSPDTGLPRHRNPLAPLHIGDPVTPFTALKLRQTTADGEACFAALATGAVAFQPMPDLEISEVCFITDRLALSRVGPAEMPPVETSCPIALRMAMWTEHNLIPAAREHLGADLAGIRHFSSYNCRRIRTPGGGSGRMSSHATANAIDISGFRFSDGRKISLQDHWTSGGPEAAFLRSARDGACLWFRTTLSPDFNSLHSDHFHLQSRGWGTCQ